MSTRRSPRFPRGKSPSPPGYELYSTVSPHSRGGGPSDFHYNLPSCASLEFCFLPSTGQDRVVHPGPPRLGRRHPIRRYQTTTAIGNNQTQLISSSLAIGPTLTLLPAPDRAELLQSGGDAQSGLDPSLGKSDKNSLLGKLNIRKTELYVKHKEHR